MVKDNKTYTEAQVTNIVASQHGNEPYEPDYSNETAWETVTRYGNAIEAMFAEATEIGKGALKLFVIGENLGEKVSRLVNNDPYDVNFNPYDEISEPYFEPYLDRFFYCHSSEQVNRVKKQIMIELKHKEDMSKVPFGFNFVTGMLANAGSPMNYVSFAKFGNIVKGQGVLKGAARGAIVGGTSNAAQELLLKMSSETYTDEEFVQNILIGTALSGSLGAIIGKYGDSAGNDSVNFLRKKYFDDGFVKRQQDIVKDINSKKFEDAIDDDINFDELNATSSVGAAETINNIRIKDDNYLARYAIKTEIAIGNPVAQLVMSPNSNTRSVANDLVSTPYWASSVQNSANVENLMLRTATSIHLTSDAVKSNYIKYYFDKEAPSFLDKVSLARTKLPTYIGGKEINQAKMRPEEFEAAVYDCLESGLNKNADNKYVLQSAKEIKKIIDPLTKQMEELKANELIDAGTIKNYVPRILDKKKVLNDRKGFINASISQMKKIRDNYIRDETLSKLDIEIKQVEKNIASDESLLSDLQVSIKNINSEVRRAREDANILKGEIHQLEKSIDEQINQINKTKNKIYSYEEGEIKISNGKEFASQIKNGLPKDLKPKSLSENISESLILIDDNNNLLGKDFGLSLQNYKGRRVEQYEILTIDELGERLWQDNWYRERPDVDDVVTDLLDDFNNVQKKYNPNDERYLRREYEIDQMRDVLDRLGYNYSRMSTDEIENVLSEIGNKGFLRKQYVNRTRSEVMSKMAAENQARVNKKIEELDYKRKKLESKNEFIENKSIELSSSRAMRNEAKMKLKESKKELSRKQKIYDNKKVIASASDEDLEVIASDLFDDIAGYKAAGNGYDITIGERGPLLSRNFLIGELEPEIASFLSKDISSVLNSLLRESVDLNLISKFDSLDLKSQKQAIIDRYNRFRNRLEIMREKTDNSEKIKKYNNMIVKTDNLARRDTENIDLMVGRLRGTIYANKKYSDSVVKGAEMLKSYNILTSLSNVVISSLSDVGGIVGKTDIKSAINSMPSLKNLIGKDTQAKLRDNPDLAHAIAEEASNVRVLSFAEMTSNNPFESDLMKRTRGYTEVFMNLVGMNKWNMFAKSLAGLSYFNKLYRLSKNFVENGRLKDYEVDWLHHYGFDESELSKIYNMYNKYGDVSGGQKYAFFRKWDDTELANKVELGSIKLMNEAVVTPGLEKNRIFDDVLGSVLFQFKSFGMSAVSRNLIPALQNGDKLTVLEAVSLGTAIGCLSVMAKDAISGREREPVDVFTAGLAQSGIFGWYEEAYKLSNAVTYGGIDKTLYALTGGFLGDEEMSYFKRERDLESVLGPSWQKIMGVKAITGDIFSGEIDKGTMRKVKNFILLQNAVFVNDALDTMLINLVEE